MSSPAAPLTPQRRYAPTLIAAHWLTFACVLVAVVTALLREGVDDKALRMTLLGIHRQAGLTVLVLLVVRVSSRWLGGAASPGAAPPALQRFAGLLQGLMYATLVVLPLLGWAASDAHGQHPQWLGVLPLPTLAAHDREFGETLEDWHGALAWSLVAMVALHGAAALWHHFVRRDDVLRAMLPGRRPR